MSRNSPLLLFIQLDALRHDYIARDQTPFLWELRGEGLCGKLQPTFGFEPDGAYLAGLYPDECDGGAHFWRDPEESPYKFTRLLPAIIASLDGMPGRISRKLLTKFIRLNKKWQYEFMPCAPYAILKQFAPAPKLFPPGTRGHAIKDLFSLCNENKVPWFFHGSPQYRVSLDEGFSRINASLFPPVKFAFWHIADIDHMGHRFGPKSPEIRKAMKRIDEKVNEVFPVLKERFGDLHIVIIGDHGMAEVRSCFDIAAHLRLLDIDGEKAPPVFIDSTMVRFWFSHRSQQEYVRSVLEHLSVGRILEKKDLERYHLNYKHNRFGDLIYLAEPGILFSPNYFQGRSLVKGMHGYAPEHPDQQSGFIINSSAITKPQHMDQPVDMRRIFPTVLKLLGIEKPKECEVESII